MAAVGGMFRQTAQALPAGAHSVGIASRLARAGARSVWPAGPGLGGIIRPFPLAVTTPSHTKPAPTAESLVLRHQLAGPERCAKQPKLRQSKPIS